MTFPSFATDCWFLTGPTASGKTTIGLQVAHQIDAEIVALDSMSVYRDMDIGTAKPTLQQQQQVRHHLLDIVAPNETFSVSDYVARAEEVVREIRNRQKQVLFVGGTPLYLKSLLRGMFEGPPADEAFRREVLEETNRVGKEALHARLQLVDPLSAAKLHPHDTRRIIRALEVFRATGEPISHLQLQFEEGRAAEECRVFVLDWPRAVLHERINARVETMFDEGLVDEVRHLLEKYGELGKTARQAVGYQETLEHLAGKSDLTETIHTTQARTRQFAKRQLTWFRSLSECRWIPRSASIPKSEIVDQIVSQGRAISDS